MSNILRSYVPLKAGRSDSEGFIDLITIDGEVAHGLQVEQKDVSEGFANIILWYLQKAKAGIAHITLEHPYNDTRFQSDGNGYTVVQAIDAAITAYKANFKVEVE